MNISLYQAASAMNANARWQEVIAENMAASSVPGYKRQDVTFQAIEAGMMPTGAADTKSTDKPMWSMPQPTFQTNFTPGEARYTGSDMDVAITGKGFFEVQKADGTLAYTRDGEFQMNGQGQLTTKQGQLVMGESGPIQLDRNTGGTISIGADGTVTQGTTTRGQIKVVDFPKPDMLAQGSGGLFVPKDSNVQPTNVSGPILRQFYLEQANTNSVTEMANMITVMRSSEANQRVIQMEDDRMGKAITELGNPS